jgi:hypothetical protein
MYYREVEVERASSITALGTRTIDLNIRDPISKLSVVWRKTNTNKVPIGHPGLIVKNILVCDGADVLFSMNGCHAQSMAYFTDNKQPASMINYATGQWSMQIAELKFGRWLYDELLALDPKRYNNLQIKIEHDIILGGATGTVGDLSVYAHCFDEKVIEPVGFLYNKLIYDFLPVAGGWYYIDLPTDFPIRAVMFGGESATDGPEYIIDEFKLTEDQGKHILIESMMERYLFQSSAYYDPWIDMVLAQTAAATTGVDVYVTPHWERHWVPVNTAATAACMVSSTAGCIQSMQTATAGYIIQGPVHGHNPFGATFLKTHGGQDVGDCWQIKYAGSGRLSLHAIAGLAAQGTKYQRVYTQQVRTY